MEALVRRRVFILGAGFSAAVSKSMPSTDELGREARKLLGEAGDSASLRGHTDFFEDWLSRLAEDQPDLTEAENLANRSLFVRLADAIAEVVTARQTEAWASRPADWLHPLVALLHVWRASAITFNYDTLIEQAVDTHELFDWDTTPRARVEHHDVIDNLPRLPPDSWGVIPGQTFRLLKLHGSLNWWWVPGDTTGATINRMPGLAIGPVTVVEDAERRRRLPGRSRFLVPPSALKSSYYNNPITKELWQRAAEALAAADDLYLVGYSLPRTDLVVGGMLRERLSADATVTVVNRSPTEVTKQLARLGVKGKRVTTIKGPDAVGQLVAHLEHEAAAELIERILALETEPDIPVTIAWTEGITAPVLKYELVGETLMLQAEGSGPSAQTLASRGTSDCPPTRGAELVKAIREHQPTELIVRFPDGKTSRIIDQTLMGWAQAGHSDRWWALTPTCPPVQVSQPS